MGLPYVQWDVFTIVATMLGIIVLLGWLHRLFSGKSKPTTFPPLKANVRYSHPRKSRSIQKLNLSLIRPMTCWTITCASVSPGEPSTPTFPTLRARVEYSHCRKWKWIWKLFSAAIRTVTITCASVCRVTPVHLHSHPYLAPAWLYFSAGSPGTIGQWENGPYIFIPPQLWIEGLLRAAVRFIPIK